MAESKAKQTKEVNNQTAVGASAGGTMEEGISIRKKAKMGRFLGNTHAKEVSGVGK